MATWDSRIAPYWMQPDIATMIERQYRLKP